MLGGMVFLRFFKALGVALAVGVAVAIGLGIGVAVLNIYLSGHNINLVRHVWGPVSGTWVEIAWGFTVYATAIVMFFVAFHRGRPKNTLG